MATQKMKYIAVGISMVFILAVAAGLVYSAYLGKTGDATPTPAPSATPTITPEPTLTPAPTATPTPTPTPSPTPEPTMTAF